MVLMTLLLHVCWLLAANSLLVACCCMFVVCCLLFVVCCGWHVCVSGVSAVCARVLYCLVCVCEFEPNLITND